MGLAVPSGMKRPRWSVARLQRAALATLMVASACGGGASGDGVDDDDTTVTTPDGASVPDAQGAVDAGPDARPGGPVTDEPWPAQPPGDDLVNAPPDVPYAAGMARFVDITAATHTLVVDVAAKTAVVTSRLEFAQRDAGYPMFDVVEHPTAGSIDGTPVETWPMVPAAGDMRVVPVALAAGPHVLELTVPATQLLRGPVAKLTLALPLADDEPRAYAEHAYPGNLLYDRHPVEVVVEMTNAPAEALYDVFTNGRVFEHDWRRFRIAYPYWYGAAGPFLRVVDTRNVCDARFVLPSVDGRQIPVRVFEETITCPPGELAYWETILTTTFEAYEALLGPYPHDALLMATQTPHDFSMEYAGAFEGGFVEHEVGHLWFARSAFPAEGRDEWIDEGIVSYLTDITLGFVPPMPAMFAGELPTNTRPAYPLADPYMRGMHGNAVPIIGAYATIELFQAYGYWFEDAGLDFMAFLRELHGRYATDLLTTAALRAELFAVLPEKDAAFERYVYGPP